MMKVWWENSKIPRIKGSVHQAEHHHHVPVVVKAGVADPVEAIRVGRVPGHVNT